MGSSGEDPTRELHCLRCKNPPLACLGSHATAAGTALTYRWEAYGNGSTTPWIIKYGQNITFSTGLPGLELPAGK